MILTDRWLIKSMFTIVIAFEELQSQSLKSWRWKVCNHVDNICDAIFSVLPICMVSEKC